MVFILLILTGVIILYHYTLVCMCQRHTIDFRLCVCWYVCILISQRPLKIKYRSEQYRQGSIITILNLAYYSLFIKL